MSCEGAKHTNLVQIPLVNNRVISLKQCGNQCMSDKYLLVLKGIYWDLNQDRLHVRQAAYQLDHLNTWNK